MSFLKRPERLKELPRFRDLSKDEMHKIAKAGTIVHVPAHWSMISEGAPPDQVYLIVEGTVAVSVDGKQIAELAPGHIVGEIASSKHVLRTATVTAQTPLELLHITSQSFEELCAKIPAFQQAVDATVAERVAGRHPRDGSDKG